mmetsp:Transcript_10714/g.20467  ORF Transcript_10714/g.20467 Transcript_10714/m.20467 type:complete len:227 (+) Transcript_10714:48-728(+)
MFRATQRQRSYCSFEPAPSGTSSFRATSAAAAAQTTTTTTTSCARSAEDSRPRTGGAPWECRTSAPAPFAPRGTVRTSPGRRPRRAVRRGRTVPSGAPSAVGGRGTAATTAATEDGSRTCSSWRRREGRSSGASAGGGAATRRFFAAPSPKLRKCSGPAAQRLSPVCILRGRRGMTCASSCCWTPPSPWLLCCRCQMRDGRFCRRESWRQPFVRKRTMVLLRRRSA